MQENQIKSGNNIEIVPWNKIKSLIISGCLLLVASCLLSD